MELLGENWRRGLKDPRTRCILYAPTDSFET